MREFGRIAAQLDLTGLEPEPANAAILVPHEWASQHGDFSRLGSIGPEVVPFVSSQDGGAVTSSVSSLPGDQADGDTNTWLVGAWLNTLSLARRARLKVAFPREYTDWQQTPWCSYPLL